MYINGKKTGEAYIDPHKKIGGYTDHNLTIKSDVSGFNTMSGHISGLRVTKDSRYKGNDFSTGKFVLKKTDHERLLWINDDQTRVEMHNHKPIYIRPNDFDTQNPSKNRLLKAYANIYSKVVGAVNLVKSASDVKYASSDYYQCTTEPSLYTSHSSLYLDDFIDFYAFRGGATKWSYGCGNKGGVGLYDYTKVGDYLYWNSNIDIQSPVDLTSDIIVRKVIAITDLPYRRWEGGLWVRRMHLDSSIGAVAQGQYVYLKESKETDIIEKRLSSSYNIKECIEIEEGKYKINFINSIENNNYIFVGLTDNGNVNILEKNKRYVIFENTVKEEGVTILKRFDNANITIH